MKMLALVSSVLLVTTVSSMPDDVMVREDRALSTKSGDEYASSISSDLKHGRISQIDVLVRNYSTTTPSRVDEKILPEVADKECQFLLGDSDKTELQSLLSEDSAVKSDKSEDLFWKIEFKNSNGATVHMMYMARSYAAVQFVSVNLDGVSLEFPKALVGWFERKAASLKCRNLQNVQ